MEYATAALSIIKFIFDMSVADLGKPQWVGGTGEYAISRKISEAEACARAETRAKLNALRTIGGERISSDTLMQCSEKDCPVSQLTWSAFDGLIRGVREKKVTVSNNICYIMLQAYVDGGKGKSDPSFDLRVEMGRAYGHHDPMQLGIETTQGMHVNVFNWNPYTSKDKQVTKIFPNQYDPENWIRSDVQVPSHGGYSIRVSHPDTPGEAVEYLHILATRHPVRFLNSYALEDFHARVLEIPKRDRRYIRQPYRIIK